VQAVQRGLAGAGMILKLFTAAWRAVRRTAQRLKEFFPASPSWATLLFPGTRINYGREVGDGLQSSVIAPPLNWLMRNFPQAAPVVERLRDGEWERVEPHPLTDLLARPTPFYGGRELWMATILDLMLSGNAYWLKVRNGFDEVVQLWWVPSTMIAPHWTSADAFIERYRYTTGGRVIDVPVADVVHIRHGLDPRNPRLGLSPLASVAREIYTDDQAANFAAAILKNLGIIGIIIAPRERGMASREDVQATKEYILQHFTGDERGKPLALGQPTDVNVLQYNMQGLDVSPLRDVAEERVCAALGIPAAVVGFGTGLQTTKVGATMREMRRMAWTDCVIPLQELVAEQVARQLLPDLQPRPDRWRLRFDTANVPALMEDVSEKHERVRAHWAMGLLKRSEAKRELGFRVGPEDEIYAQPANAFWVPPRPPAEVPADEETTDDADSHARR